MRTTLQETINMKLIRGANCFFCNNYVFHKHMSSHLKIIHNMHLIKASPCGCKIYSDNFEEICNWHGYSYVSALLSPTPPHPSP